LLSQRHVRQAPLGCLGGSQGGLEALHTHLQGRSAGRQARPHLRSMPELRSKSKCAANPAAAQQQDAPCDPKGQCPPPPPFTHAPTAQTCFPPRTPPYPTCSSSCAAAASASCCQLPCSCCCMDR
jgi:hypothetical protein